MPDTYGFLRFQIAGVAFFLYFMLFISPFVSSATTAALYADGNRLIAGVGLVIALGMPIGYIIHQFAVNKYRGEAQRRPAHLLLEKMIEKTSPALLPPSSLPSERFQLVDSFLVFFLRLSVSETDTARTVKEEVTEKLDERWSHIYARLAVGTYCVQAAVWATIVTLALSLLPAAFPWQPLTAGIGGTFVIGPSQAGIALGLMAATVIIIGYMNRYVPKLWAEICTMEYTLLLTKTQEVEDSLKSFADPARVRADLQSEIKPRRRFYWGTLGSR